MFDDLADQLDAMLEDGRPRRARTLTFTSGWAPWAAGEQAGGRGREGGAQQGAGARGLLHGHNSWPPGPA